MTVTAIAAPELGTTVAGSEAVRLGTMLSDITVVVVADTDGYSLHPRIC